MSGASHLTGNNLSGIAPQFVTQAAQIATQMQICVSLFCVHTHRVFSDLTLQKENILKTAMQSRILNYSLL